MNINDRIKEIRKHFGLNQTEFGESIGLKQSSLGQVETGVRSVSDRIAILVCEKYRVNESWLRTGEGEMFRRENLDLSEYARTHQLSGVEEKLFRAYLDIPHEVRMELLEHIRQVFTSDSDIEREVQSYREELEAEKGVKVGLLASPNTKEA